MKKHLTLISLLSFILLAVTACSTAPKASSTPPAESAEPALSNIEEMFANPELGAAVALPTQYIASNTLSFEPDINDMDEPILNICYYSPACMAMLEEMSVKSESELTDDYIMSVMAEVYRLTPVMLRVERFTEEQVNGVQSEKPLQILTGSANATEAGRQEGYIYAVYEPEFDSAVLSGESLELYNTLRKEMAAVRASVQLIPIETPIPIGDALPAFSATDLDGNPVTEDIFKGQKVTMINFWGTFCGSCIDEMPDLGEMGGDMPEGSQLLGVVIDVNGDENLQMAKDILTKAKADFVNIAPDGVLLNYAEAITGMPTTIFVDENGRRLGEAMAGSYSAEEYRAALEEYLH